ncbi:unknown (plasmid) [Crocosphaera subtropica ATCC 51142]|uniref:Ribbon-helix-helix protein CopG domain-containing protein n=1 Tax=Crocosphaera subtropica (strain ATCC 51142 / BH68) TaxID=43989 RepID=B1X356_CROS5|nr:hypothetical protein [Crocosphaera subtropica]ACB54567.1 unknown [Crocosphaera subtropica ATCC 51142]
MPIKKRKNLDDVLAQEFVYGDKETSEQQPIEPTEENQSVELVESKEAVTTDKTSIMDKLQPIEQREATKRFTVDLPDSMHRKLSILSAKTGRTKADIVRMLLDDILKDIED